VHGQSPRQDREVYLLGVPTLGTPLRNLQRKKNDFSLYIGSRDHSCIPSV
jgi:hypothetical protein